MEKLREMRDKNIHKSLAALAGPETSLEEAAKLAKVHTETEPFSSSSLNMFIPKKMCSYCPLEGLQRGGVKCGDVKAYTEKMG